MALGHDVLPRRHILDQVNYIVKKNAPGSSIRARHDAGGVSREASGSLRRNLQVRRY